MHVCGVIRYLALVFGVACYSPAYKDCEITCSSGSCPSGYTCEQGVCRAEGFSGACGSGMQADASIDGNPSVDTDGDGKNDSIDNCRTIANPDQANEDNDAFGNACDPCPPLATFVQNGTTVDANADADGDGVGNGCDPNPMIATDRIKLFEGFASSTAPTGTTSVGAWTFSNGVAQVAATGGQIATLHWVAPALRVEVARRDSIMTQMTITQAQPGTTSTGVGILDPMDANLHGVGCFNGYTGNVRQLMLLDSFATGAASAIEFVASPLPMSARLLLYRDANGARTICSVDSVMTPVSSGSVPPNGNQVALRVISASAVFDWFMWIESAP